MIDNERLPMRASQGALIAMLALTACVFVTQGARSIGFPYPLDYGEGPLLDQALRLAEGNGIYDPDLSHSPHTVSNYPPLFVATVAAATRLFGGAYWHGRTLSLLCICLAAFACAAIVYRLARDRWAAFGAAGCLLAMPYVGFWSALFRVDAMALALSLAALAYLPERAEQGRRLTIVALLLTAAAFTRQSYLLAAPLAAIVTLAADRQTRPLATRLLLRLALFGGAGLVALQWSTGGGFWFHVVSANVNAYSPGRALRYLGEFGRLGPVFVLLPLLAPIVARDQPRARVLIGSYSAAALVSGLTIGKLGSNVNYLLELCAACAIGCGWLLSSCRASSGRRAGVTLAIAIQLALLLDGGRYRSHLDDKMALRDQQRSLLEFVRRTPGRLLADDAAGLLPLAGRAIEFQPFEMVRLAESGAWDPTPFLARMERREFSAVLMQQLPWSPIHRTRWTPEMLLSLDRNYNVSHRVGYTVVYLPRKH